MLTTAVRSLLSMLGHHDDRYLIACSASTSIAGSPPPPPRLSASPGTAHSSIATQLAEMRDENETLKRSLILQSQASHSLASQIDDLESRLHGAESAARTATANARSLAAKLTDQARLWALERAALEAELETTHEKMARLRATSPVSIGAVGSTVPRPPRSPHQHPGGEGLGQVSACQKHEQTIAKLITTQRQLERQVEELTTTLRMTQSAHSSALTLAREKSSLADTLAHDLDELHAVISELRDQNEGYRLLLEERTLRGEWSWASGASSTSRTASPTAATASLSSSPHETGRGVPGASGGLRKKMSNVSIKGSLSSELARARPLASVVPVVETRDIGVGSPPRTNSTAVGCSPPPGSGVVGMSLSRRTSRAVLVKTPVLPEDEVDLELNTVPAPESILSVAEGDDEGQAPMSPESDEKRDTEIERLSTELRAMQLYVTTILSRILPSSMADSNADTSPPAAADESADPNALPSPATSTHEPTDQSHPPHSHSLADWYSRRTETSPSYPPSHSTLPFSALSSRKRVVQPWFTGPHAEGERREDGDEDGSDVWGDGGMWGSGANKAQALSGSLAGVAMEDEVVSATLEGVERASGAVRVRGSRRPESGSGLLSWLFGGGEDEESGQGDNRRSSSFL
ncbi:hypothetical protein BCR44DRAFT_1442392 [Catenaria anguillulae PL171]|uniref:Uncharacterized protein n=1 Tax=Catenaria anguillulae PL171 TaxID=765915 RepID=A0A1Y2HBU8_9FUNG|nr:hypothetical protein BCR44DRAFT_1442392 [Catenaria anguillulae PL171]